MNESNALTGADNTPSADLDLITAGSVVGETLDDSDIPELTPLTAEEIPLEIDESEQLKSSKLGDIVADAQAATAEPDAGNTPEQAVTIQGSAEAPASAVHTESTLAETRSEAVNSSGDSSDEAVDAEVSTGQAAATDETEVESVTDDAHDATADTVVAGDTDAAEDQQLPAEANDTDAAEAAAEPAEAALETADEAAPDTQEDADSAVAQVASETEITVDSDTAESPVAESADDGVARSADHAVAVLPDEVADSELVDADDGVSTSAPDEQAAGVALAATAIPAAALTAAENIMPASGLDDGNDDAPSQSMLIRLSESAESLVREEMRRRGLSSWWENTFDEQSRGRIARRFKAPTMLARQTNESDWEVDTGLSDIRFLDTLARGLFNKRDAGLAKKLLIKAELLRRDDTPLEDVHLLLHHKIDLLFRLRKSERYAGDLALQACLEQIRIAPDIASTWSAQSSKPLPAHKGYNLLISIREAQKRYDEAVELCEQARSQGWQGDWEARLQRLDQAATV